MISDEEMVVSRDERETDTHGLNPDASLLPKQETMTSETSAGRYQSISNMLKSELLCESQHYQH